jgi:hypothetical protein
MTQRLVTFSMTSVGVTSVARTMAWLAPIHEVVVVVAKPSAIPPVRIGMASGSV